MVRITVVFAFVTAYLMLYTNDSTIPHIFFEPFRIKQKLSGTCWRFAHSARSGAGSAADLFESMWSFSDKSMGHGRNLLQGGKQFKTLVWEVWYGRVWNHTRAMSKPQHPLESWSAFSEATLQSWLNRSPDPLCMSQLNLQNLPGGCLKPLY